jgi:hypothetical protein
MLGGAECERGGGVQGAERAEGESYIATVIRFFLVSGFAASA